MCECVYECMCKCMCERECVRESVYECVYECMSECVCAREIERVHVCECVCGGGRDDGRLLGSVGAVATGDLCNGHGVHVEVRVRVMVNG